MAKHFGGLVVSQGTKHKLLGMDIKYFENVKVSFYNERLYQKIHHIIWLKSRYNSVITIKKGLHNLN